VISEKMFHRISELGDRLRKLAEKCHGLNLSRNSGRSASQCFSTDAGALPSRTFRRQSFALTQRKS
jgi:hypothetical protein